MNLLRALMVLMAASFYGQSVRAADAVSIWRDSDFKGMSAKLAADKSGKGIAGITLGAFGNQSCAMWRRTASGEAELHKVKTDFLIIEQGSATLLTGGNISDPRTSGLNEVRGSTIHGGQSRGVAAGDIIRIPPGTPHQFLLSNGQTVTYFALKVDAGRSATMQ